MKHPVRTSIQLQELLRLLRRERGLTQDDLGCYLGLDRRRISQIENNPGVTNFNQLSALITVLGARLLIESIPNDNLPGTVEATAVEVSIVLLTGEKT